MARRVNVTESPDVDFVAGGQSSDHVLPTLLGSFEALVLQLDTDRCVYVLMGQFLLGQLEA